MLFFLIFFHRMDNLLFRMQPVEIDEKLLKENCPKEREDDILELLIRQLWRGFIKKLINWRPQK